ncbi:hypothetical protein D3C73_1588930 [compost metagenome]
MAVLGCIPQPPSPLFIVGTPLTIIVGPKETADCKFFCFIVLYVIELETINLC